MVREHQSEYILEWASFQLIPDEIVCRAETLQACDVHKLWQVISKNGTSEICARRRACLSGDQLLVLALNDFICDHR